MKTGKQWNCWREKLFFFSKMRYYQDAWLRFLLLLLFFRIVNRLFLSNLCQWHTICSDRFIFFVHFSPVPLLLTLFKRLTRNSTRISKIEQTIHGNDCSPSMCVCERLKKHHHHRQEVSTRWCIYNKLFAFESKRETNKW